MVRILHSEKQAFQNWRVIASHSSGIAPRSPGQSGLAYPASELAVIVSEHDTEQTLDQKSGKEHARVVAGCF